MNAKIASNLVLDIIPSRKEVIDDRFWKQEAWELVEDETAESAGSQLGKDDMGKMDIKLKENESRYVVSLRWKSQFSNEGLDSHYELSRKSLNSLLVCQIPRSGT